MALFLGGITFLVIGYFLYGKLVEKVFDPDDRETPAVKLADGTDFVVLPRWKNMLIQLLNIAGIGPVIGVILGIKFGIIALVIIPIGCVLMGAVHDMAAGMMSIRDKGANLPKIVHKNLGMGYNVFFEWFMVVLLLLVVAVFINIPADLINTTLQDFAKPTDPVELSTYQPENFFWVAVVTIFCYYVIATMFPVDKIIGKVYPFFGLMLLVGTLAIFFALLVAGFKSPSLLQESATFQKEMFKPDTSPVFPLLFVTIACGIISGFHATQSPIIARTMKSEREAKSDFYGMMIVEGIIAMIWAVGGLAIYNLKPEFMAKKGPVVLCEITTHFLGTWMGTITVLAVVILAVTSGDTALRSTRLALSEMLHIPELLRLGQPGARRHHADGRYRVAAPQGKENRFIDHHAARHVHDRCRRHVHRLDDRQERAACGSFLLHAARRPAVRRLRRDRRHRRGGIRRLRHSSGKETGSADRLHPGGRTVHRHGIPALRQYRPPAAEGLARTLA